MPIETADTKLIVKWDEKFEACKRSRVRFEQQWHLNLAFYSGKHYVLLNNKAANSAGYTLTDAPPAENHRVRAVRNKIKRSVRNEFTKLTKEEPQGYVNPSTSSDEDRLAATAAEALAEYHVASSNYKKKRTQGVFWAIICGTGFLKTYYDPSAKTEDGAAGRVMYDGVPPFNLFVPYLQLQDLEEQPYLYHCRTVDPAMVSGLYNKDIEGKTEPASSILEQRLHRSLGIEPQKSDEVKQVYIKEVWVKPCREFPQGAMFIYADQSLLYMNEQPTEPTEVTEDQMVFPTFEHEGLPQPNPRVYPYEHQKFPFQKIDHIPTGMFYGESTIKDLIPVQKDYNRIRSQIMEHRNLATNPQWEAKKGSFDPKQWSTKPGMLLWVNPGFDGPKPMDQPKLPEQTPLEIDLNNREFDDISGQFEISKGRTPPGVEAASAIAFLQEENDTILYHTVASQEAAVQESMRQTLDLIQQYWDKERIVRVISSNGELEASLFKDVEMKSGMDYRVVSDSMAPRSRAAKQAVISDLMKTGAITPQQGLRFMQFNETNRLFEELQVDVKHAQRENLYMAQGQVLQRQNGEQPSADPMQMGMSEPTFEMRPDPNYQPPVTDPMAQMGMAPDPMNPTGPMGTAEQMMVPQVPVTINPFDNHETHIDEHSRWMKSQQYEALPYQVKKIFLDHLEEHKQELALELQAMQGSEMEMEQPQEMGQP